MMSWPNFPTVYEINTWVWLAELSKQTGKRLSLAQAPQSELERIASFGFDGVWLMGVWQRSPEARRIAQVHPDLQEPYRQAIPDFTMDDVVGSPYAIAEYRVDPALGGDDALASLRKRLQDHGLRLILDFVPNHMAIDHAWTVNYPLRLVQGNAEELSKHPENYFSTNIDSKPYIYAHGRDPHFKGWSDTVQIDYRRSETRRAMTDILLSIAERCDGVRCDMAMLDTREVFLRTWGAQFDILEAEFWPAAISEIKAKYPDFLMMAEVYWDMEWKLQQQGFNYTYDKRLYDRLLHEDVKSVREHLDADMVFQSRLARFIENHDEQRAIETFGKQRSKAAAVLALTVPGLRLVHEGQLQGRRNKLPVQLGRRQKEVPIEDLEVFYRRLLTALNHPIFHVGQWKVLKAHPESYGNLSHNGVVAFQWAIKETFRFVVINYSDESAQFFLPLSISELVGNNWKLIDLLNEIEYERSGEELINPGMYLELESFGYYLFEMIKISEIG